MKINLTTMALMCIYMFKLTIDHDFIYYIHPRYIGFSIIATLLCAFAVLETWRHAPEIYPRPVKRSGLLSGLIIFTLVAAIILPAKGLTATTALKRFNSGGQAITIKKEVKDTPSGAKTSPFTVMPKSDDPGDIFSNFVFNLDRTDDLHSFEGAEVELVGFVLIDPTDETSKYHVSRFFITCCTADASPIGIPFEYSGSEYKNDDWIKIRGKLKIIKLKDFEKVRIAPSSIIKVDEPKFPYAYF